MTICSMCCCEVEDEDVHYCERCDEDGMCRDCMALPCPHRRDEPKGLEREC